MGDDELAELFVTLEAFSVRRLFGGQGIYDGAMIVAVVLRGTLYLKGDDQSAPVFEADGCKRWCYQRSGREPTAMPYWSAPETIFDDPDQAARWVAVARDAALRSSRRGGAKKAKSGKPETWP